MTVTIEHRPAEPHHHTHGPGCGHTAVVHLDHVDYLHEGVWHHEHDGHYEDCTACKCPNCDGFCAACVCEDCSCPTCVHATCECEHCEDSCANCVCLDCTCPTCRHAA